MEEVHGLVCTVPGAKVILLKGIQNTQGDFEDENGFALAGPVSGCNARGRHPHENSVHVMEDIRMQESYIMIQVSGNWSVCKWNLAHQRREPPE